MIQTTVGQKLTIIGVPKNAMLPACVTYQVTVKEPENGRPTGTQRNKRKRFFLLHVETPPPELLIFDGWELPFTTEAEKPVTADGMKSFTIDGKINLVGDPDAIRYCIQTYNLNKNFTAYRDVYVIDHDADTRTQLFPPVPLLTPELEQQARAQYPFTDEMEKQAIVAKYTGRGLEGNTWTWYLMNQDPGNNDYLWGIVDGFAVETGSFSLDDLQAAKADRDPDFKQRPAIEVWNELTKRGERQFLSKEVAPPD